MSGNLLIPLLFLHVVYLDGCFFESGCPERTGAACAGGKSHPWLRKERSCATTSLKDEYCAAGISSGVAVTAFQTNFFRAVVLSIWRFPFVAPSACSTCFC